MANDIIDINVYETTETVAITVNPNLTTVNINEVVGVIPQNLQEVTNVGSTTTNSITANSFIKNSGTSTQFLMGDGSVTIGNGGVYSYEIHVSQINGNDTTGTGAVLNPVATITKALTLITGLRRTIVIHPGDYTENPSITTQYTVLTTYAQLGGNTALSGTITTNTGCTISGLKMTNLTVNGVTGRGNINILSCDITGTFTKNGTADYTLVRFCDIGALNILSTAGVLAVFGGNPSFITVNSIGASVLVKNAVCVSPVVLVGGASFADCIVVAIATQWATGTTYAVGSLVYNLGFTYARIVAGTGSTAPASDPTNWLLQSALNGIDTRNAITTSPGTQIVIANSQILIPSTVGVARVSLSGFYSILNCVFDKPNSTLVAGGTTNSIVYSQFINADKFIKQGGTGTNILLDNGSTVALSSVGGNTNLTPSQTSTNFTINSDTGTDATIPLGNGTLAGASLNNYTTAEQTKLAGIATGAEVNVNADWNAVSGDAQILNKPTIPSIAGLATTTYVDTQDALKQNNISLTTSGTNGASTLVGATLNIPQYSGATNLTTSQTSTNFTINSSTGDDAVVPLGNGTNAGATLNDYTSAEKALVATIPNINTNAVNRDTVKLGEAVTKGQAVYVSNATGTNIIVLKASNASEATSSKTFGLIETTGVLNDIVNLVSSGLLSGLNTSTAIIGDAVWLGTSGNLIFGLANKPVTPAHLVYIGIVTRVSETVGEIFISIQNGFELSEIHDILLTSVANNDGLFYDSTTSLWKNKSISTILGYTPYNATNPSGYQTSAQVQTIADAKVVQTITNGVTTTAPSEDAIFDALSLKQPLATVLTNTTASFTTADETKLDKYPSTATNGKILQGNGTIYVEIDTPTGTTNLGYTASATDGTVTSSTGDDAIIPLANGTNAGLMTAAEKTKLTNTSGTNSGDETTATIKSKLAITTLSGSNTGDETTATIKTKLGITTLSGSNTGDQDLSTLAPKASPTFTGIVGLPSTTSIGTVTSTEIGYLDNVTSAIQTQLDNKIAKQAVGGAYTTNAIATVSALEYSNIGTKDANTLYFII